MKWLFDPTAGLVLIQGYAWGPASKGAVRFAIDTGAMRTTLSEALLVAIGYDPANTKKRSQVTTVSGVELVPELEVDRLEVLGHRRVGFPIFCLTPPDQAGIDGLLGLDFLRGLRLTLDFNTGLLSLD